jgi:Fe-S cluster biogenesis protein NfuA
MLILSHEDDAIYCLEMSFWRRWFVREPEGTVAHGPLYPQVKAEMSGVQAYARSHGGEIRLITVDEEGDVYIHLTGTCRSCPMSAVTIKLGVEDHLRKAVPGIRKIIQKR